ncbi:MAG: NADH oxidase [Flammeovirgaceae bacterium]|nr:NADH oxidase [Flammeovirgaceae bacterium]MBE62479.1 NADH oxidase [Flammeovirgaceae bacterium]MBR08164.1 NADH oxidase [Rickettsiales bacterium]|tara:strand:+ start:2248 stop:2544 length:297 start_codon:yes stop_codon:yes gene_type:complete
MNEIQPDELKNRIENGETLTILDVREPWEYDEFNIGAKLYPLYKLPESLAQLESLKNTEIIVHCQSGKRSNQARKYLSKHGFHKVRSLSGGLNAYCSN